MLAQMKPSLYLARLLGATALLALALPSCDTTEAGYHVGTLNDVYLTADPAPQLLVPADGQARQITVASNVAWEIDAPESVFSAKTSDHVGEGTITVTAGVNVNSDQARSGSLRIYARDFNKSITIELVQAKMNFSMISQDYPEAPEQGMTYKLAFNSTIDWRFNASEGEIGWLDFSPASTGGGEWNEIEVAATLLPNYTTEPRSITLQLYPSDANLLEYISLPPRFTLTQAAGTIPTDVVLSAAGEPTYYTIPLSISYRSAAPIDELGVIIAGTDQRFVAPLQQDAAYPQSGTYNFTLDGLDQDKLYTLTPFVRSKVGETLGDQIQVRTDGDVSFDGPQLAAYSVEPSSTSVAATFDIQSDVQIQTVTVQLRDASDSVIAEQKETVGALSANITWSQSVTLTQDTDYSFAITADIINPNNQSVETYTLTTLPFKTSLRTPQPGDNNPIN